MFRLFFLSLAIASSSVSFATTPDRDNAAKNTAVVTQAREMTGFSGVSSNFSGDVFLVQGDAFSLEVTGPEGLLTNLHTDIKQGMLNITELAEVDGMDRVFITVTMPRVDRISLNGAGDIIAQSGINTKDLYLGLAGRGNLSITNVNTYNLTATITGSGTIRADIGTTNQANLSITGTGNIDMPKMTVTACEASIAGSGDIHIGNATTILASIAGKGDISHEGAATVSKDIIGHGDVIQL